MPVLEGIWINSGDVLMKRLIPFLAATLLLLGTGSWTPAQEEAPSTARAAAASTPAAETAAVLVQEMARLNRSLEEISGLLSLLLDGQEVDILMKRMQFKERQLARLESEMKSRRSESEHLQDEIKQLEAYREEIEMAAENRVQGGLDTPDPEDERIRRQIEAERERVTERSDSVYRQVVELENEVSELREEYEILEEMLDERLELR
jgi:chromosome segregation ATPase